nr:MAG TPA: hypothetical protein [Caudoviricetes sp.]
MTEHFYINAFGWYAYYLFIILDKYVDGLIRIL